MVAGAAAIASSSANKDEYRSWEEAARRESERYCLDPEYVATRMEGNEPPTSRVGRTWIDYLIMAAALAIFLYLVSLSKVPAIPINWVYFAALCIAMVAALIAAGMALWRLTRFD